MNRVVKILMERDGYRRQDAEEILKDVRAELWEAMHGTSCLTPEEVIEGELGLEPDYIFDII